MNVQMIADAVKNSPLNKFQIAERSGISRTTLDNMLAGADVKISTVESVCSVIGIPAGNLFHVDANFIEQEKEKDRAIVQLTLENLKLREKVAELEGKGAAVAG